MENAQALIQELYANATPDAAAMAKYQRNQFPFLGIRSQDRREILKPYLKAAKEQAKNQYQANSDLPMIDWQFVEHTWALAEREFQYIVCDYLAAMKIYLLAEDLPKLKVLITSKSWWDSVDSLVKTIGHLVHKYPVLKAEMVNWSKADNIWLKRTAMIHQLGMKDQTDTALLAVTCENCLGTNEFFVDKGMGWVLRDYTKTNQAWVASFLKSHEKQLSNLTWREASKHFAIEKG